MCRSSKPRFASYPSERLDLRRKMSVELARMYTWGAGPVSLVIWDKTCIVYA